MIKGKTILITGASSGLGRALAIEFSRRENKLVLASRNEEELIETARRCHCPSDSILVATTDVTREEDCERLVRSALEQFGRIDIVIANAGVSMWSRIDELSSLDAIRRVMDVNYFGAVNTVFHALPHVIASRGSIVAISSIQGKIPVPLHSGYVASKHALQGYFNTLRMEQKRSGLHVLLVLPHWILGTNLRRNSLDSAGIRTEHSPAQHTGESIELQALCGKIMRAIETRKNEIIVPFKLRLLLWLSYLNPAAAERVVGRKLREQKRPVE